VLAGSDNRHDALASKETTNVDPLNLLKQQHRQVEQLFKKVERTGEPDERRELLDQISEKLALHMTIEEEIFYPAVREARATKKAEELVDEAFEEHHVVKLVLAELPKVDPEDERFEAKMTVLSELVHHHVEEEEKEMFKLARKLGKDELADLGEQMGARAGEGGEEEDEEPERVGTGQRSRRRS
jgi:hemerythrin superfamily protein